MKEETKQEKLCGPSRPPCYMPCPCLKHEDSQESLCINGEEVNNVQFVDLGFIPTYMLNDKNPNNELCLNTIYSDENGFIRCGTNKRLIKVRNYQISTEDYLDALTRVKELYNGDSYKINSCPECLYKAIVSQFELQEKQKDEEKGYVDATGDC
jgi:hypothetical protein